MKIGNTGLEIKFDKLDIVQQYLDICKPCKDLKVVHNSVFDKEEYYKQFILTRKDINETINEWNETFDEQFTLGVENLGYKEEQLKIIKGSENLSIYEFASKKATQLRL